MHFLPTVSKFANPLSAESHDPNALPSWLVEATMAMARGQSSMGIRYSLSGPSLASKIPIACQSFVLGSWSDPSTYNHLVGAAEEILGALRALRMVL